MHYSLCIIYYIFIFKNIVWIESNIIKTKYLVPGMVNQSVISLYQVLGAVVLTSRSSGCNNFSDMDFSGFNIFAATSTVKC